MNDDDRVSAFTEQISTLKVGGAKAETERLLFGLGVAALVVGVALAVFGGIKAAGADDPVDQTSFVAAGSLLGLTFVVAGMALFLRYSLARFLRFWVVRLVHEHRTETDRLIRAIETLAGSRAGGVAPAAGDAEAVDENSTP